MLGREMKIDERKQLREKRRALVRVGAAPDGLPLILDVDRGAPADRLLVPVARAVGIDDPPERWAGRLRRLGNDVCALVDERQFLEKDGETFYLSWLDLKTIAGSTLLERLLLDRYVEGKSAPPPGELRPATQLNANTLSRVTSEDIPWSVGARALIDRANSLSGTKLAIGVDTERVLVARAPKNDSAEAIIERPYHDERLARFKHVRFRAMQMGEVISEDHFGTTYVDSRHDLFNQCDEWFFDMPMTDILNIGVSIADALAKLHESKRAHCDIKPANVVVTASGVELIDGLDVPFGVPSPGLTSGYAAPEQVLGDGVSGATDQYSFAVMLTRLLGGVLHGRETAFKVPTGGSDVERFTLLDSPSVYLDAELLRMPPEARNSLQDLLHRCLCFEQRDRFETMKDLADELASIASHDAFFGTVQGALHFGVLTRIEDVGLGWVVRDQYPQFR